MKILRLLGCLLAAALTAVGQTNIVGSGFVMGSTSGSSGGSGTVTSVGLTIGGFTVTGSPVTTSGTLAATLSSPVANGIVTSTSGGNLQATTATMSLTGNVLTFAGGSTFTDNGSGTLTVNLLTSQTFNFNINAVNQLMVNSLGYTSSRVAFASGLGSANSPAFTTTSATSEGMYFPSTASVGIAIATNNVATWTATLLTANEGLSVAGTAYSYGAPVLNGASGLLIPATTYTLTGTSGVTNFGSVTLNQPTYTNASVNTITNLATLYVANSPAVAGSQLATNPFAILIGGGSLGFSVSSSGLTAVNRLSSAASGFIQDGWTINARTLQIGMQGSGGGYLKTTTSDSLVLATNSVTALTLDTSQGATFANKVVSTSPSAGMGYTTGAGGAVTQLTSRTTGVTLNTVTGAITGINTSLAATTAVTFTVTDSAVAATDKILVHLVSGGAVTTSYYCSAVAAGSFNITLYNENTVTADTTTPVMGFEVLKGTSN